MKNPLLKKLQITEEFSVLLMNSNPAVHPLFEGVRIEYKAAANDEYDSIILFTKDEKELRISVPKTEKIQSKGGRLWLSY